MKLIQLFFVLMTTTFLFSCTENNRTGIDPRPEVRASAHITESFRIEKTKPVPSDLAVVDTSHVSILKSALGKEFLFSTNLLSQTPTPMFSALQSRVVSFILRDQKVYLLDVTKNNVVGENNIQQNLILAEYPVLKETSSSVVFDFNEGMKQIFTVADMFGSDDPGFSGANYKLPTTNVNISYLDEVTLKDNALFIRQVAQVNFESEQGTEAQNVEARYQIKPYLPDTSFVPVKSPGFDKVGYFEANPLLLKDGSTRVYAMKWNDKKTIQFSISANTPAQYRDLVREALLYWNKILGADVVQVTQLTDLTITAPHFDTNIIQWADWDAAGYAFADAHIDPRSGQVTSAQIFIPSAFVQANVAKRNRLLEGSEARPRLGLKGFSTARLCERNLAKDLNAAETQGATPQAMDKAMRDYVYEVIAHEMGHVLGLRHNFAGNLAANYDFKDRKALIQSYYKNMKSPAGIVDSSSVMEYSRFEESAWNGDQFQNGGAALTYDKMAIEYLYLNKSLPEINRPVYCTDSHISVYADCNMSDAGRSIVSAATGAYQFNLDSLAARMINLYISKTKLADDSGIDLVTVAEVNLNAKSTAKTLGVDLAKFVSLLKQGTKLIAVRSELLPVLLTDEESVVEKEKEYLQAEVDRLGGLSHLLAALPKDFDSKLTNKFSELLENPLFNSGTLVNGQTYSFTENEKQIMKKNVALFSSQIKNQFILNEIKALSGENFNFDQTYGQSAPEEKMKWTDSALTENLADISLERFQTYSLDKTATKVSSEIKQKDGSVQHVELPVYTYPQDIRLAAVNLLSNDHEAIDWGYSQKNKMSDLVRDELSIIGDTDKIDFNSLNKAVLKWYLFNKQLESSLPN